MTEFKLDEAAEAREQIALKADEKAGYHQFKNDEDQEYGSFEVFFRTQTQCEMDFVNAREEHGEPDEPGWYWWACFPGCLPDGEASGPYATSTEAYDNALDD